jgi:poly(hydroxyalkanoate) depolymerase family esterase
MQMMGELKEYMYVGLMYKLFVPSGSDKDGSLPLVVMLHGCKQNPIQFAEETRMNQLAEKENFIVLYPAMDRWFNPLFNDPDEVNIDGCWNWFLDENQHRGEGLPESIIEVINDAQENLENDHNLSIDWNRVYAAGLSAGGAMACILGVTYPDIFSGIAVCSGLAYDAVNTNLWMESWTRNSEYALKNGVTDPYDCGNKAFEEMEKAFKETGVKRKIPVIVFHGVSDTRVHPINGEQVVTQWAQTNFRIEGGQGIVDVTPSLIKADTIKNGRSYTKYVYHDKNNGPFMEFWLIHGMKHAWSGGSKNGKFTDPLGPDATSIIWDFFKNVSLP